VVKTHVESKGLTEKQSINQSINRMDWAVFYVRANTV